MATEDMSPLPILPDEVVERILAMVSFPSVFKARILSKSWLARFSSISSKDDEGKRRLAISFQKQLIEQSSNWETFCPVCIAKDYCTGYGWPSRTWRIMPSLSFLPDNVLCSRSVVHLDGSLVLVPTWPEMWSSEYGLYVANVLTRTWKRLPPPPQCEYEKWCVEKLVTNTLSDGYKVILFCSYIGCYRAQIYDSKSHAWSIKTLVVPKMLIWVSPSVYLNGVLNMVSEGLLAFSIEKETLEQIQTTEDVHMAASRLVVCSGQLLVVVVTSEDGPNNVRVLKFDVGSHQLSDVSQGPPLALNVRKIFPHFPVGDGDCIFIGVEKVEGGRVLVYNIQEDEWSCFPFPENADNVITAKGKLWDSSFRPGLNPFMEVITKS